MPKKSQKKGAETQTNLFRSVLVIFILGFMAYLYYDDIKKIVRHYTRAPTEFVYRPEEWPSLALSQDTTGYAVPAPAFNQRGFTLPGVTVPTENVDWNIPVNPGSIYGGGGCGALTNRNVGAAGSCYWVCGLAEGSGRPYSSDIGMNCLRPNDRNMCTQGKQWALTFDDGPHKTVTPKLLDSLKQKGIKATFFLCGFRMVQSPELVKRIFADGHELGIHTWSHHALTTLSSQQIIGEIMWTMKAFYDILGVIPKYVRPPLGDFDDRVRSIVEGLGLTIVMWNINTDDFTIDSPAAFASVKAKWDNLMRNTNFDRDFALGIISLEHDTLEETLQFFDQEVYPSVQRSTWPIVTMSQCLNVKSLLYGEELRAFDADKPGNNDGIIKTTSTSQLPYQLSYLTMLASIIIVMLI